MNLETSPQTEVDQRPPLVVDLDGTLIKSDLLIESALSSVKQHPLSVLQMLGWLRRGKAALKAEIAARVDLDIPVLPYNEELLAWLREEKRQGRYLVLATGSNQKYAHQINDHLRLFDEVLASDSRCNLSAERKRDRLIERFGAQGFDYAANGKADLKVWSVAREGVVVRPERTVLPRARSVCLVTLVFSTPTTLSAYLRELRIHQWLKNTLVFVPLLASQLFMHPEDILHSLLAFLAFGLCASSVYVLNDLLDLEDDRHHRSKRLRPFAAGEIPIAHGLLLIPALVTLAVLLGAFLGPLFVAVLGLYYGLTLGYSLVLKRKMMVDVITLAILYTTRILAGTSAISIPPSFWLLAFSMFIFLSLAIVKRYTELIALSAEGGFGTARGRGYNTEDVQLLASLGGASGYLAVLVLALYINAPEVRELYSQPQVIWLACPVLLYWISRVWVLAHRGLIHDDPVVFAIEDRVSRYVGILFALIFAIAI